MEGDVPSDSSPSSNSTKICKLSKNCGPQAHITKVYLTNKVHDKLRWDKTNIVFFLNLNKIL